MKKVYLFYIVDLLQSDKKATSATNRTGIFFKEATSESNIPSGNLGIHSISKLNFFLLLVNKDISYKNFGGYH